MSEKENNPEQQRAKLTDKCNGCNKRYNLTETNTIAYLYTEYPDANHVDCTCPHCSKLTTIYIGEATTENVQATDIYTMVRKIPDDKVLKQFMGLKEIPLIREYEITPRHEALVQKFGETIMAMPVELFWENIEAPTERPYPSRWM